MQRIRDLVAIAGRRLGAAAFIEGAHWALLVVAAIGVLLMVGSKLTPAFVVPWTWVVAAMAAVVLGAGLWNARRSRLEPLEVAIAIDQRLLLRERLSNAICCADREDPFAQAAVEDGVGVASTPDMPSRVRRGFPVTPPRAWWASPLVALAAVAFSALPQGDLFAREAPVDGPELLEVRQAVESGRDRLIRELEQNPALREEMSDLVDELNGMDLDGNTMRSPEELRRELIRRATQVNERLAEVIEGERGMTERALRDAMRNLERPGEGAGKEMIDAMRRGDFQGAKAELDRLLKDLDEGNLDPAQREALAEQIKDLAEQLERIAEQKEALEEALRKAGLDPQLANNPDALEQAIKNDPNLNEQQRQELQQMAQAQQAACQMCEQMGQAAAAMAGALGQGGQQAGEMGEGLQQMLGDAEMLQMMMMQAQAAMGECQGQCQGAGQGLGMMAGQGQGGGMGGRGSGAGGEAPVAPTPTGRQLVKENVAVAGGDIIARQLVRGGEQITGEARERLRRLVSEEFTGFEESVTDENIPPHLRQVQQHYFGRTKARIRDALGEQSGEGAAQPAGARDGK